jgi:hypothetical protein
VRKTAGAQPDEWVQPAGASDAYSKGDRVTFQGQVWDPAFTPEPADDLAAQVETLTAQVDALLTAQAGVDPAVMAQLVTLGATLVGSADQLQSALTAVSGSNTAKAPLQIVNAAVQAAADT